MSAVAPTGTALAALLAPALTVGHVAISRLEAAACVLSVWMVVCNLQVRPLGWPLAILASIAYAVLFWSSRLYGDAALQAVFVAMAAWGWWRWLHDAGAAEPGHGVRRLGRQARLGCVAAMAVTWPSIGWFLAHHTDSDVPWWDAFPTAGSLIGQWLLARKFIENWAVWLVVNVVGALLFAYKGLAPTVLLYAVFAAMSVAGWRAWSRGLSASGSGSGSGSASASASASAR